MYLKRLRIGNVGFYKKRLFQQALELKILGEKSRRTEIADKIEYNRNGDEQDTLQDNVQTDGQNTSALPNYKSIIPYDTIFLVIYENSVLFFKALLILETVGDKGDPIDNSCYMKKLSPYLK